MDTFCFQSFDDFVKKFDLHKILKSQEMNSVFLHSSISKVNCYERLEFLGDAILAHAVSDFLYYKFPKKNEGELSKMKSFLVSREIAAKIADMVHLTPMIIASNLVKKTLNSNINVRSEVFEALISCIYNVYGMAKIKEIIEKLVFPFLEFYNDPKTELQEMTMSRFKTLPKYVLISKVGSDHNPVFTVEVHVDSIVAKGIANKKNLAEREASREMINLLKSIKI